MGGNEQTIGHIERIHGKVSRLAAIDWPGINHPKPAAAIFPGLLDCGK